MHYYKANRGIYLVLIVAATFVVKLIEAQFAHMITEYNWESTIYSMAMINIVFVCPVVYWRAYDISDSMKTARGFAGVMAACLALQYFLVVQAVHAGDPLADFAGLPVLLVSVPMSLYLLFKASK
ncbi:hypothetical protein AB4347_16160 [Vibrio breoganii]|uniref:hypothetical protein n=1 Tax=Vibrio breoganii TaxID=553239 RepID=UPI000C846B67|nr:hypothetical protein [Vibrio breoganii]PMF94632.1 hypothetical protein BCV08_11135 [Vibrio breoganii]